MLKNIYWNWKLKGYYKHCIAKNKNLNFWIKYNDYVNIFKFAFLNSLVISLFIFNIISIIVFFCILIDPNKYGEARLGNILAMTSLLLMMLFSSTTLMINLNQYKKVKNDRETAEIMVNIIKNIICGNKVILQKDDKEKIFNRWSIYVISIFNNILKNQDINEDCNDKEKYEFCRFARLLLLNYLRANVNIGFNDELVSKDVKDFFND